MAGIIEPRRERRCWHQNYKGVIGEDLGDDALAGGGSSWPECRWKSQVTGIFVKLGQPFPVNKWALRMIVSNTRNPRVVVWRPDVIPIGFWWLLHCLQCLGFFFRRLQAQIAARPDSDDVLPAVWVTAVGGGGEGEAWTKTVRSPIFL